MKCYQIAENNLLPLPIFDVAVPAGFPSPALDFIEERLDLSTYLAPHPLSTFYVYCEGDSMQDAFIPEKALLVIDRSIKVKTNDIVLAHLSGEWTVKSIRFENQRCFLVPANEKYPVIEVTEDMNVVVWGKVTSIIIKPEIVSYVCARRRQ